MTTDSDVTITPNKEFDHLIKLMDDEDVNIYKSVKDRFLSYGILSEDFLKGYLNDENLLIKKRANEIISILNFTNLEYQFNKLKHSQSKQYLEKSIFLIASYGYPLVDMKKYEKITDEYVSEIKQRVINKFRKVEPDYPLDLLETINEYLFGELKFKGNKENFYDPDNSFINKVIDNKTGIPITLSVIYLIVAKKLNLPIYGINMPGHFLLKYENKNAEYYIDPFNEGIIISGSEAERFAKNIGIQKSDFDQIPYLNKSTDNEILLRILRNLLEIYRENKEELKVSQIEKLMNILVI
ncbi:MAG TPA: transglutaminase-like domain-containing protein [Ignavibacteria bacterium]|mgnify:CR=1 FL=1|nr:transglutaminase-like domain-containing protein [Ignavibacteria bacterium]HQY52945.1 transglutaminase-like domain-containing protein [Ignavibacteria bacterium]HRA99840.1 transglutaminase-like domain-containing protein [Ignavibacteria bacterium]